MSSAARSRPPVPPLAAFPHHTRQTLRYSDTDKLGHVNNTVFAALLEAGRTEILHDNLREPEGTTFILARTAIDFLGEMHWPGTVDVGTGLARIGTSSVIMTQALYWKGTPTGTAESVIVLIDGTTRRPLALPPELRAICERLLVPGAA